MDSNREHTAGGPTDPVEPGREIDADSEEVPAVPRPMTANESSAFSSGDPAPFRAGAPRTHTDAARLAEIRQRILDGAYNSLETVEQVARRLLASGDL